MQYLFCIWICYYNFLVFVLFLISNFDKSDIFSDYLNHSVPVSNIVITKRNLYVRNRSPLVFEWKKRSTYNYLASLLIDNQKHFFSYLSDHLALIVKNMCSNCLNFRHLDSLVKWFWTWNDYCKHCFLLKEIYIRCV